MIGKTVFCLAIVAGLSSAVEISEEAKGFITECRTKFNIEVDQIKKSVESKKLPETEDGKCFLECVMEKVGLIENGKLNAERAKELNALKLKDKPDIKAKADEVVDKCSAEVTKPEGKCEYGVEISKCAMKYAKEMGIPPPNISQ